MAALAGGGSPARRWLLALLALGAARAALGVRVRAGSAPAAGEQPALAAGRRRGEIMVIGAGHGRTGSTNMKCALAKLGFKAAQGDVFLKGNRSLWLDWAKGGSFEPALDALLSAGYNATTADQPTGYAYKELMARYPQAKVVLGVHPHGADGWVRAVSSEGKPFPWHGCFFMAWDIVSMFGDCCNFFDPGPKSLNTTARKEVCKREYLRDNDEVRRYVPKERLLEFSPDMGWEPLCKFLGLPVPSVPFPHLKKKDKCEYL